ncbi:MAG: glucose-6-phosphate dehydrogenase [Deltaproteobacteria bacterium]|nr:glucose-6-phosphate dehydrogenase [Deltaproteobacteria bacterium]
MSQILKPESCVLTIFGASGDLTRRKLVPALFDLYGHGQTPEGLVILGVSRSPMTDQEFRDLLAEGARQHTPNFDEARWKKFSANIHYFTGDGAIRDTFVPLSARIKSVALEHGITRTDGMPNVLFYLSVAPTLIADIVEGIGSTDIVRRDPTWARPEGATWHRIIIEKPFGVDLESARALNLTLARVFEEGSIYRIDHYLGKELVQNMMVLRFANSIFEPLWNRNHVDHIQVTAAEAIGVGSRAGTFYDTAGAVRDMIQSHLMQILAIVAMEPPTSFDAWTIMREKINLLGAAVPISEDDAAKKAVFGRYGAGAAKDEVAYINENGVDAARRTETFAAVELQFDTWRWAGVPFFLRTGKKMARKQTEVIVQFRSPPTNLFRHIAPEMGSLPPSRLVINIAPDEGISLRVHGKVPGATLQIDSAKLDLDYKKTFGGEVVEAYGPLLLDAMRGDRTLYKHRDEVEIGWRICQPLLDSRELRRGIETYAPGSWGPPGADILLARAGRRWHNPENNEVR